MRICFLEFQQKAKAPFKIANNNLKKCFYCSWALVYHIFISAEAYYNPLASELFKNQCLVYVIRCLYRKWH